MTDIKSRGKKRQQQITVASIAGEYYDCRGYWNGNVTLSCGHGFSGSGSFALKVGDSWGCSTCRELETQKRQPKRTKIPAMRAFPLIRQKPIKEIAGLLRVDQRTAQRCATSPWMVSDRLFFQYVLVNLDANEAAQAPGVGNILEQAHEPKDPRDVRTGLDL